MRKLLNFIYDRFGRKVVYWLTDRGEKPPMYKRFFMLLVLFAPMSLLASELMPDLGESFMLIARALFGILVFIGVVYLLFWQIARRRSFVVFRNWTQEKDDPFGVGLLSSQRDPEKIKRAG